MWETTFSHTSATPLPPHVLLDRALRLLHDFETVVRLNPDCRGCNPLDPASLKDQLAPVQDAPGDETAKGKFYYEVEDDLPFIPKKLWSGGVKYRADFIPTADGCSITVYAPGNFTSTNHWKLIREGVSAEAEASSAQVLSTSLANGGLAGNGWYVQILSDARCPRAFAGFVKGFLKNSHEQLQRAFVDKLRTEEQAPRSRRPTIGRRRSSAF